MNEIVAVANPAAANGRARRRAEALHDFLAKNGVPTTFRFTRGPGDATRVARDAVRTGADVVLAIGGDGTLNEVVNGFLPARSESPPKTALAIAPLGTGTDFAKTVGQSADSREVLGRLRTNRRRTIDAGRVEFPDLSGRPTSRHFLNIAEFGSGGAVVERVNRTTKILGGRTSFLLAILRVLPKYVNRRVTWRLDDGRTGEGVANNFVVANGRYFGGGLMPAPEAELDDGLLDVVIFGDIDWSFVKKHLKDLRRGAHLGLPEIAFHRARAVETTTSGGVFLDLDGELVGTDPTRFEVVPRAIDLLV